jgi:hypothetical protein
MTRYEQSVRIVRKESFLYKYEIDCLEGKYNVKISDSDRFFDDILPQLFEAKQDFEKKLKTRVKKLAKQDPNREWPIEYVEEQCMDLLIDGQEKQYNINQNHIRKLALNLMQSTCNLDELEAEINGFLLAHNSILNAIEGRNFHQNLLENIKKWVLAEEKPWGICLKAFDLLESLLQEQLETKEYGRPLFEKYFGKDEQDKHQTYIKYLAIALVNKKNNSSHKAHEVEISENDAIDYLCILNIVYTYIHTSFCVQ